MLDFPLFSPTLDELQLRDILQYSFVDHPIFTTDEADLNPYAFTLEKLNEVQRSIVNLRVIVEVDHFLQLLRESLE